MVARRDNKNFPESSRFCGLVFFFLFVFLVFFPIVFTHNYYNRSITTFISWVVLVFVLGGMTPLSLGGLYELWGPGG